MVTMSDEVLKGMLLMGNCGQHCAHSVIVSLQTYGYKAPSQNHIRIEILTFYHKLFLFGLMVQEQDSNC
jgi:hypothetical protein